MALPREILPGTTYLVTRRCTQRRFLLQPKAIAKQVFGYCLAWAQQQTNVQVHAAAVMSNHVHLVVTDPDAELPKFTHLLHMYVAKCMNAHYGRWENLWAGGTQASYVRLVDDADMLDKAAYAITNPVAAGLVPRSSQWPGFLLWQPGDYVQRRPDVFFDPDGPMPDKLRLQIAPLPLTSVHHAGEVIEQLRHAVAVRERKLRSQLKAAGETFLGVHRVLAQSHDDSPQSCEPRRAMSPRVAAKDKWRRIEVLQRLETFIAEYRDALANWVAGERDTLFPHGTYQLRVVYGVTCADS